MISQSWALLPSSVTFANYTQLKSADSAHEKQVWKLFIQVCLLEHAHHSLSFSKCQNNQKSSLYLKKSMLLLIVFRCTTVTSFIGVVFVDKRLWFVVFIQFLGKELVVPLRVESPSSWAARIQCLCTFLSCTVSKLRHFWKSPQTLGCKVDKRTIGNCIQTFKITTSVIWKWKKNSREGGGKWNRRIFFGLQNERGQQHTGL